jgi:hypothetical protein
MTSFPHLRALLPTLAFLFATVTLARPAHAGALHTRDEAHLFSANDLSRLRSAVAAAPFDARFVVTSEYPDAQALSRYVGSLVNEPNMIAVALDPQHHQVFAHFGTGVHIPRTEWPAVERAGNDAFRRGDWEAGAAAIFAAASRAASNPAAELTPIADARPSLVGPGILLLVVLGAIGVAVYFARRRSIYGSAGTAGYGASPFSGPGYPGAPPQGGIGPLGGGLIGAGLGGLAGYEIGKMEGEREARDRDASWDRGSPGADPGGNFDAGGGGSGWDDNGGDAGGDGGGFDGGGGDAGGGGSDF